jgi:hypothetical protein
VVWRVGRKLSRACGILALAAVIVPSAAHSQAAPPAEPSQPAGLTAEELLQAARADGGLDSLDQAPAILQLTAGLETSDAETAWELEEELLALARLHPTDVRTVPILREIGDRRLARATNPYFSGWVCQRESAGSLCRVRQTAPIPRPCGPKTAQMCYSRGVYGPTLYVKLEAMNLWSEAIRVFVRNRLFSSPELQELERKLMNQGSCELVRQGYIRLMTYAAINSEPALDQVMTLVEAADSDLVCSNELSGTQSAKTRSEQKRGAIEAYQKAYELLDRLNVEPAKIAEVFSPAVPIMMSQRPPVGRYPMPQAASPEAAAGHIDVAFEITAEGRARKVKILSATPNTAKARQRELVESIEDGLFRPRVTDGRIGDSRVVWRYYW